MKRAIMSGAYKPGAALASRALAEAFGISASPVRDALKRLEADQAIEGRQKSAYYIRRLTSQDYWDILQIRLQLEGYATRSATQVITEDDIRRLEELNVLYSQSESSIPEALKLNFLFHFQIYRLCQSQRLVDLIENLWTRIGPTLHYHTIGYDIGQVADNHDRILRAFRQRDAKAAGRALERDLNQAAKVIMPRLPNATAPAEKLVPYSSLVI